MNDQHEIRRAVERMLADGGDYATLLWIQALVPEMQSVGLYLNPTKSKLLVPRRGTVEKMKPEVAASYNALVFKSSLQTRNIHR